MASAIPFLPPCQAKNVGRLTDAFVREPFMVFISVKPRLKVGVLADILSTKLPDTPDVLDDPVSAMALVKRILRSRNLVAFPEVPSAGMYETTADDTISFSTVTCFGAGMRFPSRV